MARGDDFRKRLSEVLPGDALRYADMMAEAIALDREARGLEVVGKDGRTTFSAEELQACYCLDDARKAYLQARRLNSVR